MDTASATACELLSQISQSSSNTNETSVTLSVTLPKKQQLIIDVVGRGWLSRIVQSCFCILQAMF